MEKPSQTPAALGYRMPAEWEPHTATWLSWPRREGISFPDSFDCVMPALRAMVEALIESEQVCINICNGAHQAQAREVLRGLPMEQISFHLVPTNEPWCRDHGPIFLTRDLDAQPATGRIRRDKLAVVDWDYNAWGNKYPPFDLDEVAPTRVAEILDVPVFYPGMILEGGAIDVNGAGALLTTESCLLNKNRNPSLSRDEIEQRLRDYLGVRDIVWIGDGIAGDDTNFYIANSCVLVPTFADPADEAALSILRESFPNRRVIGIDCRELIWGLGAFHCLTQQQPAI